MVAPIVATSGRHSVAMGKGLQGGTVGQVCMFQVQCKDASGENRTRGGDVVIAKLMPPPSKGHMIDCHVIDNSDGSYTCTYLPVKALRDVDIMVSVNGTRLADTPFKASFDAGKTEPSNCRAFGPNLHHGVAGKPLIFHVLARDAYANQRLAGGDAFKVRVQALSAFNAEFAQHIKKWSTEAALTDMGDGTYAVSWSTCFAGWYTVSISLDRVPICKSSFKVCVLAAVARIPDGIAHKPCYFADETSDEALPPAVSARSCALIDDVLCVRKPLVRKEGERLPRHDRLHLFHTAARLWTVHEVKGPTLPEVTELAGVDSTLLFFAHSGGASSRIDSVFATDLDALRVSGEVRRHRVICSGPFPAATDGAQLCTMRDGLGAATVWFVGGKDPSGRLDDVYAYDTARAAWRCVHSTAVGVRAPGAAPAKREGHSVVAFLQSLWIFGGRDVSCLADLHCLDTAGASPEWKTPQVNGELPSARKYHSAVLLEPTGYMLVVGGLDDADNFHPDVVVLNLFGLSWARLDQGRVPRHTVACACVRGELFTFGGCDVRGEPYDTVLTVDLTTFTQRSCLELRADTAEYVCIKGQSASLLSLRTAFTLEAWVLPRSFPPYATILSKASQNWMTGFGLAKYGAGKGDMEEVNMVNFFLTPGYSTTKVTAQIDPHVWTHIAGVYDGSSLKMFINGRVTDTFATAKAEKEEEIDALHAPKADLCIGAHPNKAAWDGLIDEVRVWNVVRSEADIRAGMAEPIIGQAPGLVGQWTFNEGAGELVVDTSGMRNHGTIEGTITRTLSTRTDKHGKPLTAAEQRVDDVAAAFTSWKATFEQAHGRSPSKADILLTGSVVTSLARKVGYFD